MFFFNNLKDGFSKQNLLLLGGNTTSTMHKKQTLWEALTGEENPDSIGSLLFILVLLVHLLGVLWLAQPAEPITQAQPLMMEVSMLSVPGKQPTAEPPAPPKPVAPTPPVQPKQPPVKKPVQKKKPVQHKQLELPKTDFAQELAPAPSLTESAPTSTAQNTSAANSAPTASSGTQGNADPFSEASFNANYGTNPKPKYPAIARSRGWQGKVLLRVSVSAEGLSESVEIFRSCGHDVLDESAVAAVEKWEFVPAKRGNTAVSSSVIVPIIFTLNN